MGSYCTVEGGGACDPSGSKVWNADEVAVRNVKNTVCFATLARSIKGGKQSIAMVSNKLLKALKLGIYFVFGFKERKHSVDGFWVNFTSNPIKLIDGPAGFETAEPSFFSLESSV